MRTDFNIKNLIKFRFATQKTAIKICFKAIHLFLEKVTAIDYFCSCIKLRRMNKKITLQFGIIAGMIGLAALSRFLPHPPNFTPITGMALFGAAYFMKKYWAFIIPFIALWGSSLVLDNVVYAQYYDGFQWFSQPWVFVSLIAITFLGTKTLQKISFGNLVGTSLVASTIFFLVTNFGSWQMDLMGIYADNFSGLLAAYSAGLPFFLNTLAGDLFYVGVLFGGYELVKQGLPQLNRA